MTNIFLIAAALLSLLLKPLFPQERDRDVIGDVQVKPTSTGLVYTCTDGIGGVLQPFTVPEYPEKFWLQTDHHYLTDPHQTDAFLVVEVENDSSQSYWAAGYSLAEKKILIGELSRLPDSSMSLSVRYQKSVEILNARNDYVFRWIFWPDRPEMQLDVNGVPLKRERPFPLAKMRMAGMLVRRGQVLFEKLDIGGR